MRVAVPLVLVAAVLLGAALAEQQEQQEEQRLQRERRQMPFRPMFVTRQRDRLRARQQELRRRVAVYKQWRQKHDRAHSRRTRALQYPVGGEPGMALKVAVNDLLFQSAPTNDLPDLPDAQRPWRGKGALRPMLLAKLRAAQISADRRMDSDVIGQQADGEEAEAFLLLSANGGKPAIVPASGTHHTKLPPAPGLKAKAKVSTGKSSKRSPYTAHKRAKRDAGTGSGSGSGLGQKLLDMVAQGASPHAISSMVGERARVSERVKQYDMQGAYPAYSYTHGRYTRAASPEPSAAVKVAEKDVKVKVKVSGIDDDEDLETAQSVVFRPLFVHHQRQAMKRRRYDKQRRLSQGLPAKKPIVPVKRPGKQRGYIARYPQRRYSQPRPKYYYRKITYYN